MRKENHPFSPLTAEKHLAAVENSATLQPCNIIAEVKRRTGALKYWCVTHHAPAWGPGGQPLGKCAKADVPPLSKRDILNLNIEDYPGGVALWGALPPVYNTASEGYDRGVHVHARRIVGGKKSIDRTYVAVRVQVPSLLGDKTITMQEEDAVSYVASAIFNKPVKHLDCPRCGHTHLDTDYFSVNPHLKHQCNACGREFFDSERSVGNPVAAIKELLQDASIQRLAVMVDRPLVIKPGDCPGGLQIWASNPAIIWTSPKAEEVGIHVHGYDERGRRLIDDTFSSVEVNEHMLDHHQVRYQMAQQSLLHLRGRLCSLECPYCGRGHFDTGDLAIRPHREHVCEHCGKTFPSPGHKLTISNPLISLIERLSASR